MAKSATERNREYRQRGIQARADADRLEAELADLIAKGSAYVAQLRARAEAAEAERDALRAELAALQSAPAHACVRDWATGQCGICGRDMD